MTTILPHLLTSRDVALWLALPARRVEKMARNREIPSIYLPGGDIVFDAGELASWIEALRAGREAEGGGPHA